MRWRTQRINYDSYDSDGSSDDGPSAYYMFDAFRWALRKTRKHIVIMNKSNICIILIITGYVMMT